MQEPSLAKWLRWLVYVSAVVPLIIFSQYISPFHFGKVVVFRAIVQVMAAIYLLLIWRDKSYYPKKHIILWGFIAFTAAFTLSTITSDARIQSFWGTLERMGGLFTFWHYLVFYIIAVSVLRTRRDWQILLDIMIGVGVLSAIYGFLQKTDLPIILGSGDRQRIFGTIGNPALFAGYQILVAYLALTLAFLKRTTQPWRIWYWIAGAAMLLAAISTAVRGTLIGIVVGTLTGALLWSILNRSKRAKIVLLTGIAGVAVFVFLAILLRSTPLVKNSPYLTRVTDFSSSTFTVKTRIWAWTAGIEGWSEGPKTILVGWGPENFNIPFSMHFNPKFFTGPGAETFFDRAHNMFMEILVTMGLIGLVTYLYLFYTLFKTLAKFMREQGDARVLGIGFTALTVAYIIHNCFIFDTSANFLTFFMILAFVTHVSLRGMDTEKVQAMNAKFVPSRSWSALQVFSAGALGIIVIVLVYQTNIKPALANYSSTRAIVAGWRGDWNGAVGKYRQAIGYNAPGRYEYRNRFAQFLLELGGSPDISKIPNFKDVTLEAIQDVQDNVAENPDDYLPYLYLSRLNIILGKDDSKSPYNDAALEMSGKALEISPTFVRTYYEVAQAYLNKKDFVSAFDWFRKAKDLNPDVGVTWWYMGTVRYQMAADKKDAAGVKEAAGYLTTALQKGYTMGENDSQKVIGVYVEIGDYQSVVMVLEQLVSQFPGQTKYLGPLAAAYVKVGRVDDALRVARQVLNLAGDDAAKKAEAEKFIRSLGAKP